MPTEEKTINNIDEQPIAPPKQKGDPTKNLKPFNTLSPQEQRKIASKGGKKAAENRAYNRSFKAATEWALSLPAIKGNATVEKIRKQYPCITNQDALVISVMAEGIKNGDYKSLIALRDTIGETPRQAIDLNATQMKIEIETVD